MLEATRSWERGLEQISPSQPQKESTCRHLDVRLQALGAFNYYRTVCGRWGCGFCFGCGCGCVYGSHCNNNDYYGYSG
ncbi:keratin-associated protein 21-3 [Pteropus medius]|uniref:uncharacterized protein LOC120598860 n=1 Tax=Pteropus vampyrus TaxID=132908 RepID=UPI00196A9EFC|nr:uncharacterized protein LOC120598860 [Pteropus giganteus]